ncbi:MAG: ATP-dependent helicase [Lachnospiraceae bacterium]|nr:ATP-dependent helicase [Lachnospiraceae bacterium]
MNFNESQNAAISHYTGPCLTLAGPGSGKTLVITRRTKNLIEQYQVDPTDILVVTFTRAAAQEMKTRFQKLMGERRAPVTFGTFHAIFFSILKYAYHYSADNIIREEQKFILMRELVRKFHLDYEDENEYIEQMLSEISLVKNEGIDIAHYYSSNCAEDTFRRIFDLYQNTLRKHHLIDFDDMLVYTYELFRERKDILALWQKRYPYILVDEFQDINKLQYEIVKMLAAPKNNLFVVGDDDQSIYRFRGASPGIMQSFARDFPHAAHITLDVNYRCATEIVKKAGNLIAHNTVRFGKKIVSYTEAADAVEKREFKNQREQNLAVIRGIQSYVAEGGQYADLAVLYRTNTQPGLLMEQLMEYNIPFKAKDRMPCLYDHWIAKDIFTYIRIAMGSRDRADFLQIMNRPKRYIGRDSLEEKTVAFDVWADYYAKNDQEWIAERIDRLAYDCKMLSNMAPYAAINYIRRGIGYDDYLKEYADYRGIRLDDLTDLLDQLQTAAADYPAYPAWQQHITEYKEELQNQSIRQQQEKNRVVLSTFHSAKGLEYEEVYLVDVNEKLTPYKKAVLAEDLEEERRMFYVGMTRAKKRLHIYAAKSINNHEMDRSRFWDEMEG